MFTRGFIKTAQIQMPAAAKPAANIAKPAMPNIGSTFTQPQSNSPGRAPNVGPNT